MRFAVPHALWLLAIVPLLAVWLILGAVRRRRALARLAAEPLLQRLVEARPTSVIAVKGVLLALAVGLLVLAAARPQWGATLEQVTRKGVDVMIAVDISESMLAEDMGPARLQKSVEATSRLLDRLQGDRVGLLAFSGSAGVLCPLTLDYNAVRIFLDSLTPNMISYPGSSLADAIKAGAQGFGTEERKFKVMVLFSDGEDQVEREGVERAATEAASQGVVIHTVGVGTPAGGPIPERGRDGRISGYRKDREGRVVTTRLDEALLSRVSEITAGRYYPATAAESELDLIAESIAGMDKKELQARLMTQFEERFQVPLGAGLLLLVADSLLSNRKRVRRAAAAGPPATAGPDGRRAA